MNRRYLVVLLLCLVPLGAHGTLWFRGVLAPVARQDAWDRPLTPLMSSDRIGQSFQVPAPSTDRPLPDRLDAVDVRVGTYGRHDPGRWELRLHRLGQEPVEPLLPPPEQALRRSVRETARFEDNRAVLFRFPAQPVRPGERYYAEVACLEAPPGGGATLWIRGADVDPAGDLYRQGRIVEGELTYRALGRLRGLRLARRLLAEATWWKPRGANRPAVILALAAALIAAAASLIWMIPAEES